MVTQTNQGAGAPNAALSYKEECVPITSTRSEVAGDIVHAMQVQLTPKEQARLARSQRTNSEAYDLYLRALVHVGMENRQDNQADRRIADFAYECTLLGRSTDAQ